MKIFMVKLFTGQIYATNMNIKCLFGMHKDVFIQSNVFSKIRDSDGLKVGEVELNLFICERCKRNILHVGKSVTDKTFKNP